MSQAHKSTSLLTTGRPRSVLEGVPIAIKDELDQVGHPTTVGTAYLKASMLSTSHICHRISQIFGQLRPAPSSSVHTLWLIGLFFNF